MPSQERLSFTYVSKICLEKPQFCCLQSNINLNIVLPKLIYMHITAKNFRCFMGDLLPWDATGLMDLMSKLLTFTQVNWAEPEGEQVQSKFYNHKMDALQDLGHNLLRCHVEPVGFPHLTGSSD